MHSQEQLLMMMLTVMVMVVTMVWSQKHKLLYCSRCVDDWGGEILYNDDEIGMMSDHWSLIRDDFCHFCFLKARLLYRTKWIRCHCCSLDPIFCNLSDLFCQLLQTTLSKVLLTKFVSFGNQHWEKGLIWQIFCVEICNKKNWVVTDVRPYLIPLRNGADNWSP